MGSRAERSEAILRDFLSQPTVVKLTLDDTVSEVFAELFASQRRKGQPVPTNDLWIAGQAVVSGCPVLTFDKHFAQLDGVEALVLGSS